MIGWIDGNAGASGDMLLGTLVHAGVPLELLQETIDRLDVGVTLRAETVERAALVATKVHVDAPHEHVHRHLSDVLALFGELDTDVRIGATAVFERLAVAEAAMHGIDVEQVHFHEVGALDSIADIVGVVAGFNHLGLTHLSCSTLSLGSGMTRSAHGPLPVPAPAVLRLLQDVAPVRAGPAPYESTTPTGAALLASLVDTWQDLPPITISAVGLGAGGKDTDHVANVVRLVIGQAG